MKKLIGKKIGMGQILSKGIPRPVTLIQAGPCWVTKILDEKKDGEIGYQIGYGQSKKIKKPQKKALEKVKIKDNLKYYTEVKISKDNLPELGSQINITIFNEGDLINVSGTSKGKGFAGVIKRHGFSRGPETHGSDHHRRPGSIGSMFPQRVVKGKKMPGHAGFSKVTVKNLKILKIYPEKNIIAVSGAIPGPNNGIIILKEA